MTPDASPTSPTRPTLKQVGTAFRRIELQPRLGAWAMRSVLGVILLVFAEVVMWRLPTTRLWWEWPLLWIVYTCLGAVMLDGLVRFHARDLPLYLLAAGAYGLIHTAILNPEAFINLPASFLIRGMGLQTAGAFYALVLFIVIITGKPLHWLHFVGAASVGLLWGIWAHWFPLRTEQVAVPLETAQVYMLSGLAAMGVVFFFSARIRLKNERDLLLLWWEAVGVLVILFGLLITLVAQERIQLYALLILTAIGAFVGWALNNRRQVNLPSVLAPIATVPPNLILYVIMAVIFLVIGSVAYTLIDNPDSLWGRITYFLILFFGIGWLPVASMLLFVDAWNMRKREQLYDLRDDLFDE